MKDKRNYGIDLLRLFAMFLIIILHSLGHGGVLKTVAQDSIQYKFVWLLEIFAYSATNIFAVISGYVAYHEEERRTKYSNYINLWFQVVFYCLLITTIFKFVNPELVSKADYFKSFFPVTYKLYWYFTAYTGLFILMPLINKAIRNCGIQTLKKLFITIIISFSIYETISKIFVLNDGYSFVWLSILYILGAIIKKCDIGKKMKPYQIILLIIMLNLITYFYLIYGVDKSIYGLKITKKLFINYTSPTVLGVAILNVILFSKFKFKNLFKKIIRFAAPSSFAIYLINEHYILRDNYITNSFASLVGEPVAKIYLYIIGFAIIFVIGAVLIDKIRYYIFKVCKIDLLAKEIERILNIVITKLSTRS